MAQVKRDGFVASPSSSVLSFGCVSSRLAEFLLESCRAIFADVKFGITMHEGMKLYYEILHKLSYSYEVSHISMVG